MRKKTVYIEKGKKVKKKEKYSYIPYFYKKRI